MNIRTLLLATVGYLMIASPVYASRDGEDDMGEKISSSPPRLSGGAAEADEGETAPLSPATVSVDKVTVGEESALTLTVRDGSLTTREVASALLALYGEGATVETLPPLTLIVRDVRGDEPALGTLVTAVERISRLKSLTLGNVTDSSLAPLLPVLGERPALALLDLTGNAGVTGASVAGLRHLKRGNLSLEVKVEGTGIPSGLVDEADGEEVPPASSPKAVEAEASQTAALFDRVSKEVEAVIEEVAQRLQKLAENARQKAAARKELEEEAQRIAKQAEKEAKEAAAKAAAAVQQAAEEAKRQAATLATKVLPKVAVAADKGLAKVNQALGKWGGAPSLMKPDILTI